MVLSNFQGRGVLLIWIIIWQGPIALAVGAGGGCLDILTPLSFHFSISISLRDGPIYTEIVSQRAVQPKKKKKKKKKNNQPTC